jgi:hypothetical protein
MVTRRISKSIRRTRQRNRRGGDVSEQDIIQMKADISLLSQKMDTAFKTISTNARQFIELKNLINNQQP